MSLNKTQTRDPDTLSEVAWKLIDEAISSSIMTLENGKQISLAPSEIVELAKWLSTSKAKKPRPVNTPEDFILKPSTGEDNETT